MMLRINTDWGVKGWGKRVPLPLTPDTMPLVPTTPLRSEAGHLLPLPLAPLGVQVQEIFLDASNSPVGKGSLK